MTENTRPLRDFMQSLPTGSPARLVGTDLTAIDVSALLQDGISSVSAGVGISINPADPKKPIISVDSVIVGGASAGATAVQPGEVTIDDIDATGTPSSSTYLRGDGAWATPPAGVTSVGVSVPTGFSVSGSPVTSSGTIAITYSSGYQGYTTTEASKLSGLTIGTTVQAYSTKLDTLAGQTWAADRYTYYTGVSTAAIGTLTSFGRSLIDDADAATARATLGLGSLATLSSVNNGNWSGAALSIANGGTGQTSASDAFTALKQSATTSATGVVQLADVAAVRARTADRALTASNIASAKAAVSLPYAATRSLVWTDGWLRTCTLTGNMTISNPTSVEAGDMIVLSLVGNDATERSVSWGIYYKGNLPDVTVTSTRRVVVFLYALTAFLIVVSHVVVE